MNPNTNVYSGSYMQQLISHRGIVPSLYTVNSGSYGSNSSYGSGKPATHTYESVVIKSNTSAAIRQHDSEVDFNIQVALDITKPSPFNIPPFIAAHEIRIKSGISPYLRTLPCTDPKYGLPLFNNVEMILSESGVNALTTVIPVPQGILQARLLYGGDLALVILDTTTNTIFTITTLEMAQLFNSLVPNQQLLIRVSGTYRGSY